MAVSVYHPPDPKPSTSNRPSSFPINQAEQQIPDASKEFLFSSVVKGNKEFFYSKTDGNLVMSRAARQELQRSDPFSGLKDSTLGPLLFSKAEREARAKSAERLLLRNLLFSYSERAQEDEILEKLLFSKKEREAKQLQMQQGPSPKGVSQFQHEKFKDFSTLADMWLQHSYKGLQKYIWNALLFAVIWKIWLARNSICFNNLSFNWMAVAEESLLLVAFWSRNRYGPSLFSINDFIHNIEAVKTLKIKKSKSMILGAA